MGDYIEYDKGRKSAKRLTQKQRAALVELRDTLMMTRARFNMHELDEDKLPTRGSDVDTFVKQRTLAWRQSWVFPLLDALLGDDWDTTAHMLLAQGGDK